MSRYGDLVRSAAGERAFDLVVENARLVDVNTREIRGASIGIASGRFAYVGGEGERLEGAATIDAGGRHVVPGLIDSHMHIESSMCMPAAFAEAALPRGTVACAADPHEIANVLGIEGVRLLLRAAEGLPLKFFFLAPSTVPSAPGFETAGAEFTAEETGALLRTPGVIGLGEVMDFWGVVSGDRKLSRIVEDARAEGRYIEGHCPVFSGRLLQAYIAAGIDADHTIMNEAKVRERLRAGMTVQIQSRFITPELMGWLNTLPCDADVLLVTDDVHADQLRRNGHLDANVRKAIACGLDPVAAVQAATIRAARRLRLYDRGSIAPGRIADLLILDSLQEFSVNEVVVDGKLAAARGKMLEPPAAQDAPVYAYRTMKLRPLSASDFEIRTERRTGSATARVVRSNGESSYTKLETAELPIRDGALDLSGTDLRTMAVFERHGRSGAEGGRGSVALLAGLGAFRGAMASSYAHDCHNLVVAGENRQDMALAANRVVAAGGGMAVALDGKILAELALPIAGILSPEPVASIADSLEAVAGALAAIGARHADPVSFLTLMALAVSPEAKLTDAGIVDVVNKRLLGAIAEERD